MIATSFKFNSIINKSHWITTLDSMYYILNMRLPIHKRIYLYGFSKIVHKRILPFKDSWNRWFYSDIKRRSYEPDNLWDYSIKEGDKT